MHAETGELTRQLNVLRRQIRIVRTVERAVRWAFYASVLLCLYLTALKFVGLSVPRALCFTALAAIPLGMAAREWARRLTLRDCAVLVDRRFQLEERVSSAVEARGPMAAVLTVDAERAMKKAGASSLGRLHWPRETPFFALTAIVAMALWAVPAPDAGGAADDPALQGSARDVGRKLREAAQVPPQAGQVAGELSKEMSDIAAKLETGTSKDIARAIERLRSIEERAEARLLDSDVSAEEAAALRALADRASGSGASLGKALEWAGQPVPDWKINPSATQKLARVGLQAGIHATDRPAEIAKSVVEESGAGRSPVEARNMIAQTLAKRDWPHRYDAVVFKYFKD